MKPGSTYPLEAFKPVSEVFKVVRPLLVHVLAESMDEPDLPGVVERAAMKAGMEKVYAE